jgi:myo-inositol 2-dehydrogenase / D-chiro-inositol 1-dehydrogenase
MVIGGSGYQSVASRAMHTIADDQLISKASAPRRRWTNDPVTREAEWVRIGLIGVGRIGALHAETLTGLDAVDQLIITDPDSNRARQIADRFGAEVANDPLTAGIDALVIASPTGTHPELIRRGVEAGIPVFCEKPVAPDAAGTRAVIEATTGGGVPVQIGFQRRFDAGYQAARDAAMSGRLGWLHTVRSTTLDPAPPPAGYIEGSGGIFRDCAVHDFDSIRWATGREVLSGYATGSNQGEDFFEKAGDVDTASAMLTLDGGTIALVSCTRYNGAGYDARLELLGSQETAGASPPGRFIQFLDRFGDAYRAELTAFIEVATGKTASPCTPDDALEAFYIAEACTLSMRRNEPVTIEEVRQ